MSTIRKENGSLVKKAGKLLVDLALNITSNNPIANSIVTAKFNQIELDMVNIKTYSTTEKVVGTWIDGKALYCKSYSSNTTISSTTIIDSALTPNNINVIKYDVILKAPDNAFVGECNFSAGGYDYERYIFVNSTGIILKLSNFTITGYRLAIYYTKNN